jgi:hypothetical protein
MRQVGQSDNHFKWQNSQLQFKIILILHFIFNYLAASTVSKHCATSQRLIIGSFFPLTHHHTTASPDFCPTMHRPPSCRFSGAREFLYLYCVIVCAQAWLFAVGSKGVLGGCKIVGSIFKDCGRLFCFVSLPLFACRFNHPALSYGASSEFVFSGGCGGGVVVSCARGLHCFSSGFLQANHSYRESVSFVSECLLILFLVADAEAARVSLPKRTRKGRERQRRRRLGCNRYSFLPTSFILLDARLTESSRAQDSRRWGCSSCDLAFVFGFLFISFTFTPPFFSRSKAGC